jgi:hypothetical protein
MGTGTSATFLDGNNTDALTSERDISDIFSAFGLVFDDQKMLLQPSQSRSLYDLIQNHHQVSSLLEKLGLPGFRDDPSAKGSRNFAGGLIVTSAQILCALDWSPVTYTKKSKAFKWASSVHNYRWSEPYPSGIWSHPP